MFLIVGLGNPGQQYKNTPHNLGRETIESLARILNFPEFKNNKKLSAEISKKNNLILARPTTFMNESGAAAKKLLDYYQVSPADCWIIHDDFDLPLGKIKISINRSSAGHNGAQSIIDHLKTKNFVRFRIGARIANEKKSQTDSSAVRLEKAMQLVLKKFNSENKILADNAIKLANQAIVVAIEKGIEKAMGEYNK
jgi:PTH1 family peptidyl-tRNA hydrolase